MKRTKADATSDRPLSQKWMSAPLLEVRGDTTERFMTALETLGAQYKGTKEGMTECGRGLIATEAFEIGTEICSIPAQLAVTGPLARKSAIGKAVNAVITELQMKGKSCHCVDMTNGQGPAAAMPSSDILFLEDQLALYAFLMYHRGKTLPKKFDSTTASASTTEGEFWSIYAQWLPTNYTDPLNWSPDLRSLLLAGTNLLEVTNIRTKWLRDVYVSVICEAVKRVAKHLFKANVPPEAFSWSAFLWAHSAYTSRSFPASLILHPTQRSKAAYSSTVRELGVMLPYMDLTNHLHNYPICWSSYLVAPMGEKEEEMKASDNSRRVISFKLEDPALPLILTPPEIELKTELEPISHDTSTEQLNINGTPQNMRVGYVAGVNISAEQQIFNNYGPKSNDELLLGYGFAVPNNPYERFPVVLAAKSMRLHALAGLALYGLSLTHYIDRHLLPAPLLQALRISGAFSDADLSLISAARSPSSVLETLARTDTTALHIALGSLRMLIFSRLKKLDEASAKLYTYLTSSESMEKESGTQDDITNLKYLSRPEHSNLVPLLKGELSLIRKEARLAALAMDPICEFPAFDALYKVSDARFALACALHLRSSQRAVLLTALDRIYDYECHTHQHVSHVADLNAGGEARDCALSQAFIDDFEDWKNRYRSWVAQRAACSISDVHMNLRIDPSTGLLSFNSSDARQDRIIVSIPAAAWITVREAYADETFRGVLEPLVSNKTDEAVILMFYIAHHICLGKHSKLYDFLRWLTLDEALVTSYKSWAANRLRTQIHRQAKDLTSLTDTIQVPLLPACIKGLNGWTDTELSYFSVPSLHESQGSSSESETKDCPFSESRAVAHVRIERADIRTLYDQSISAADADADDKSSETHAQSLKVSNISFEMFALAAQILSQRCASIRGIASASDSQNKRVKTDEAVLQVPEPTLAIVPWPLELPWLRPEGSCRVTITPSLMNDDVHVPPQFQIVHNVDLDQKSISVVPATGRIESVLESFAGQAQPTSDFNSGRGDLSMAEMYQDALKSSNGLVQFEEALEELQRHGSENRCVNIEEVQRNSLSTSTLRLALERTLPASLLPAGLHDVADSNRIYAADQCIRSLPELGPFHPLFQACVEFSLEWIVDRVAHYVSHASLDERSPTSMVIRAIRALFVGNRPETIARLLERRTGIKYASIALPSARPIRLAIGAGETSSADTCRVLAAALPVQLLTLLEEILAVTAEECEVEVPPRSRVLSEGMISVSLSLVQKWSQVILYLFTSRRQQHQAKLKILSEQLSQDDDETIARLLAWTWHQEQAGALSIWSRVIESVSD